MVTFTPHATKTFNVTVQEWGQPTPPTPTPTPVPELWLPLVIIIGGLALYLVARGKE